jgi:hypothetical protein
VFAIGLLSHFDIRDWIASRFEVLQLGHGILGGLVQHGDWNHCR